MATAFPPSTPAGDDDRHPIETMMAGILGLIPTVDEDGNVTGTVSGETPAEVFARIGLTFPEE